MYGSLTTLQWSWRLDITDGGIILFAASRRRPLSLRHCKLFIINSFYLFKKILPVP